MRNYTISEKSIKLEGYNSTVRKQYLRLFTRMEDEGCVANVTLEFTHKFGNAMDGKITLNSPNTKCLPSEVIMNLSYPFDTIVSSRRITNYTIIVFMTLCFFCFAMIRQIKKVEENDTVAKRMSLTTIGWNVIWNFSLFNIYFSYSVLSSQNAQLMAPAFFYFMI